MSLPSPLSTQHPNSIPRLKCLSLTGEILGSVELPAPAQYGMMTYMHEGKQYIVVQIGSIRTGFPGSLVAFALQ